MSYPFPLPEADSIRVESRLRPEQVDATYPNAAALNADIAARIPRAADVVMMRLRKCAAPDQWPLSDEEEGAVSEQLSLATQATAKRTESSLYFTAGQLREAYRSTGIRLNEEANALIDSICAAVQAKKASRESELLKATPSARPRSAIRTMTPRI